ncbi:MAG: polyprenyl synthetase family protein [Clostridia bacterium]|nr:polyprenyl synthetase family protein [Clostridia bacterium]
MRSYAEYQALVESALVPALESLGPIPLKLREAMAYSLEAGGKRLRPVLLLAACECMGGNLEEALPFACALEMIHTYSLIHDDLPAMDNDDLRRGRPTNHKAFGEAVAILAGDGLLSAAMELMLRAAGEMDSLRGVRAAHCIARRCGISGMVAGQTVDVTEEGTEPTEEKVRYIHLHKTADLLTAPMEAGFHLACAKPEYIEAAVTYGQNLGLAFQMVDDLLDVEGSEAALGKKTGVDAALGKLTWVALRGTEGTRDDAARAITGAVEVIRRVPRDMRFFTDLAEGLLTRKN